MQWRLSPLLLTRRFGQRTAAALVIAASSHLFTWRTVTAEAPPPASPTDTLVSRVAEFLTAHPPSEFKKCVTVELRRASRESTADPEAPRRVLGAIRDLAAKRRSEVKELLILAERNGKSSLLTHRLQAGCAQWLDLLYAMTVEEASMALRYEAGLRPSTRPVKWKPAYSPGAFSLEARHRDFHAISQFVSRLAELDLGRQTEPLLPVHEEFLAQTLSDLDPEARARIRSAVEEGAKNPYDLIYWNTALFDYEQHGEGQTLFLRVCRAALRQATPTAESLHRVLRVTSYPGGGGAIHDPGRMMRFHPRVLQLADRAAGVNSLDGMSRVGAFVQDKFAGGRVDLPEDFAQQSRQKGLNKFFSTGKGACETFCSLVMTPLLAQGHSEVFPLFISRPVMPRGHWIVALVDGEQIHVIDGGRAGWGPPKKLHIGMQLYWMRSRRDAPFVSVRLYRPTLAAWVYTAMFVGYPQPDGMKAVQNEALHKCMPWARIPDAVLGSTADGLNRFDVDEVVSTFVRTRVNTLAKAGIVLDANQIAEMTEALRTPIAQLNALSAEQGVSLREIVRAQKDATGKAKLAAKERKREMFASRREAGSACSRAVLSVLTPSQREAWLSIEIRRHCEYFKQADLSEDSIFRMQEIACAEVRAALEQNPDAITTEIWPQVSKRVLHEVLTEKERLRLRARRRGEEADPEDEDI